MFSAKVIKHSLATNGRQALSMVVTMPQMIEQEFLRHRVMCCSFSSTRAIPMKTQLDRIFNDPFTPLSWGKNGKGMQAKEELNEEEAYAATSEWETARHSAVLYASRLAELKVHKQIAGRLLQPFAWRTGVITATDWMNFFYLRVHPDAQPEIQYFAYLCLHAYLNSTPTLLQPGEWHTPFVDEVEAWGRTEEKNNLVSAARCARSSYNRLPTPLEIDIYPEFNSDFYKPDPDKDVETATNLKNGSGGVGHWSPFEHQLQALSESDAYTKIGPFHGFRSYRSFIDTGANIEDTLDSNDLFALLRTYEEMHPEHKVN